MGLLQGLVDHAMDDYDVADRDAGEPKRARMATVVVLAVFALLLVTAAAQTRAGRPQAESEQAALVAQIAEQKVAVRERQAVVSTLQDEVETLRAATPVRADPNLVDRRVTTGAVAVAGPGVRIVVDNATNAESDDRGRVQDRDLQLLVNGLWLAGAEAIAINGNRLTSLSSIRTAGEAITVNYKSLSPPYVVSATGDPKTLQARFLETPAGLTWSDLEANFGLGFESDVRSDLELPAATERRVAVRFAQPVRSGS